MADANTWLAVWGALGNNRIPYAPTLARVSMTEIRNISSVPHFGELILPLWQAVRIERANEEGILAPTLTFRHNDVALPEALRAPPYGGPFFGVEYGESKSQMGIPSDFEKLCHMARISALQEATPDSQHLMRFIPAGSQANIMEQARLAFPSVASGLSCYLSFCSLLSIAPFPPTSLSVRHWGAMFGQG